MRHSERPQLYLRLLQVGSDNTWELVWLERNVILVHLRVTIYLVVVPGVSASLVSVVALSPSTE